QVGCEGRLFFHKTRGVCCIPEEIRKCSEVRERHVSDPDSNVSKVARYMRSVDASLPATRRHGWLVALMCGAIALLLGCTPSVDSQFKQELPGVLQEVIALGPQLEFDQAQSKTDAETQLKNVLDRVAHLRDQIARMTVPKRREYRYIL